MNAAPCSPFWTDYYPYSTKDIVVEKDLPCRLAGNRQARSK